MQRPWLAISLVFIAGSLCGAWAILGLLPAALWCRGRPGVALACLTFAAGGAARHHEARWQSDAPAPLSLPLEGTVIDCVQRGPQYRVRVQPDATPDHWIAARLDHRPPGLAGGSRVLLTGALRPLDPADNPGGFDAEAHGRRQQVRWRLSGDVVLRAPAGWWARGTARARDAARRHLSRSDHPYGAGVLTGLLLGDRNAVPETAQDGLAASGLGHLLAVSGLHVGGLGAALALIIGRIGRRRRWQHVDGLIFAVSAPLMLGFVALAGFPLSACRAAVMIGLYLLGRALGRPPDALNLLGLAAIWAIAMRPSIIWTPAFQLSFGAVLGLIWLTPRDTRRWTGALWVALIAWIVTAPIQAVHFGTWAPISAWANLALLPFALLLVPLGLFALLIAPLWIAPLNWATAGAELLADFAIEIGEIGGLRVVGSHAAWWLALGVVALVVWRTRAWRLGVGLALTCVVGGITQRPRDGVVDVLAIGQGDAIIVRDAGRAILIDVGPPESAGRLLGALRRAGIGAIDAVYISHGHPDHDGGLHRLIGRIAIGAVYTNGRPRGGPLWQQVRAGLAARGVRVRPATAETIALGRLRVQVLPPPDEPEWGENDTSLLLAIHGPALSMLFTGDIEGEGEAYWRERLPAFATPVVLKVPHHGSKTSSSAAFLDALAPAAAVFPVGRRNRYRFPHHTVRARYAARGVPMRRTDRDGRVRVDLVTGRITALHAEPLDIPPTSSEK